ncbi:tape measure protein [Brevundimonas diminuta]|uniref:tape measure protein n=1 Tax=Brevundimonas diminuta TaxID=293 RepID=UPI003D9A3EF1
MARRVAELDYRVTGAEASTTRVRTLSQALETQKRNAQGMAPALAAAQRGTGMLGAVNQASAQQVAMLTGALGPLGAGLANVASRAPLAANGLMAVAAQQERMGLLSRASNLALLGGAAVMAAGAGVAVGYAGSILRGADAYAAMTARINTFSAGAVAAAQNERALYERAMEARTGVESLTTLFVRISPAIEDMGKAQADALQITESVSKALAVQGATTAETTSATVQLSQALASGVLRGDEFRSLMESAPQLMRYIAQNITIDGKTGVAFGQLRALANDGKLGAEAVMEAILKAQAAIEADFATAPKTAAQGWQVLKDQVTRTVGEISKVTGLQQGVFDFLDGLAKRLDGLRRDMLLNPDAFEPAKRAAEIFGDALNTAGRMARGVYEHFDLIVGAAQALIALKAGELLAGGFALAATKAREVYAETRAFLGQGRMLAASQLDQTGTVAALNARQAAIAAEARAIDLRTQAELRGRTAVAARQAADLAAAQATQLKARAGAEATAVAAAEARANALNTAAERAEAAAKSATTAANNAQTASSTRLAVAQQAEAIASRNVTVAMAAKAVAGRALAGVYALLGGGIGVLTLALGGLLYGIYSAESALREKIRVQRDAIVVSDELEAISRAMASASWDEVPALLASADALLRKASAARELAAAQRDEAAARVKEFDPGRGLGGLVNQAVRSRFNLAEMIDRGWQYRQASIELRGREANLAAATGDEFAAREAQRQIDLRARTVEANRRREENRTGLDRAGRPIDAARRADNSQVIEAANAFGLAVIEATDGKIATQRSAMESAQGDERERLARGLTIYNRTWEAAAELATVGQDRAIPTPPAASGGGGKKGKASAEDRAVSNLLERVADAAQLGQLMGRPEATGGRFSVRDGKLYDGDSLFVARSEDEARAAQQYLEQIEAITGAKAALVAETGMTREALAAQAQQTLATALSTSQATEAERRWQERLAEARGESTAGAQAEREVSEARRQGAEITDEAAKAYIALAAAKERARRTEEALNAARPVVAEETRRELDRMGALPERWRTDTGEMGFDVEAALRDWAAAKERIAVEVERRIRAEQDKQVLDGLKTREQADRDTSDRIAASRVALEAESAEQVADIWRRQREDDHEAWRQKFEERLAQERQAAESVTGALEDLFMGGDPADIGKRFVDDLLRSMWQELIGNPLNLAIRNAMRELFAGEDGGSGGGAGGLWSAIGNAIGGLFNGPGHADGGLPGHADGGLPGARVTKPGLIRGPGGPREDRIAAWVSNREFISNAAATEEHLPLLEAMNAGRIRGLADVVPFFSDGGLPGTSALGRLMAREIENGDLDLDYGSRAATADRDRALAGSGAEAAPRWTVNVINQSSQPVEAEVVPNGDGFDVLLEDAFDAHLAKAGKSGKLTRAMRSAPQPRRR